MLILKDFTWKADKCEQEGYNIQLAHSAHTTKLVFHLGQIP